MALSYSLFQAPSDSLGVHPTWVRGHCYNSLGKAWRSSLGFSHFLFSVLLQRSVMTESEQALRLCGSLTHHLWTRILAEKSLLYFFESYLCGDTSDANTCPSTGMCSSGDGMEWAGRQDQTLGSPLSPCNSVVSRSFLSFSPEKGEPSALLFVLDFVAVKRNHALASSNRSSWKWWELWRCEITFLEDTALSYFPLLSIASTLNQHGTQSNSQRICQT